MLRQVQQDQRYMADSTHVNVAHNQQKHTYDARVPTDHQLATRVPNKHNISTCSQYKKDTQDIRVRHQQQNRSIISFNNNSITIKTSNVLKLNHNYIQSPKFDKRDQTPPTLINQLYID